MRVKDDGRTSIGTRLPPLPDARARTLRCADAIIVGGFGRPDVLHFLIHTATVGRPPHDHTAHTEPLNPAAHPHVYAGRGAG